MAFTVKGEYKRLIKYKNKCVDGKLPFECGCACGYVTRIDYVPHDIDQEEAIIIWGYAGFDDPKCEHVLLCLTEKDVRKRYLNRKYYYNKQYNILESFVR